MVTNSHLELLQQYVGSKEKAEEMVFYTYGKHINGFAAILEEEEANKISKHPWVISIFRDEAMQVQTTRSWDFVKVSDRGKVPARSIWAKTKFGKDTIIANLDFGVWPESKSFSDKEMGPIPSKWKGFCDNNTKAGVFCNRKLIGARWFNKGRKLKGKKSGSARDFDGHGTHTLSTAGGNIVPNASIFGLASGFAAGGAPGARVAAYKVCWKSDCYGSDILAGYDAAIHDGVDVISVSLGMWGPIDYVNDPIAIGAFHAVANGIMVVASAMNDGPKEASLSNPAPWIFTVGASSLDRQFQAFLSLGNSIKIKGFSLSDKRLQRRNSSYPLIKSVDARKSHATIDKAKKCCLGSLDPKKAKGKIVICQDGDNERLIKGQEVIKSKGIAMILVNDEYAGSVLVADPQLLPHVNIAYKDGLVLDAYMNSTRTPIGYISGPETVLGVKPTPMMADFSSRGPSLITPEILKPDITAPGEGILAAFTGAVSPRKYRKDKRRVEYNLMSGTSMSCPHVAGVAGLLKTMYPSWSPAAIRSAIMTTATTLDNTGKPIKNTDGTKATPFGYGSGHFRPNQAMDPGLVYDITPTDYLNFMCALGYNATAMAQFTGKPYQCPSRKMNLANLNYPSISVPSLNRSLTVTRTVKNVGMPGTYKVRVQAPVGIRVSVNPKVLAFTEVGEEKGFSVGFKSVKAAGVGRGYVFGMIIWSDGKHYVRTPLAVRAIS